MINSETIIKLDAVIGSKHKYHNITGVILAGGRGTRMGKDKAMLKIDGKTFFDRTLKLLNEVFFDVLIAGDRKDLARSGVPCYPDLYPGSALGGLYTGIVQSKNDMIFVCPCDLPFLDLDIVRLIASQDCCYDVVVPRTTEGLEPIFARYNKNCLEPMKNMLDRKEFRIFNFYHKVRVRYLGVAELPQNWQRAFMNINTPEDYSRIKEIIK